MTKTNKDQIKELCEEDFESFVKDFVEVLAEQMRDIENQDLVETKGYEIFENYLEALAKLNDKYFAR